MENLLERIDAELACTKEGIAFAMMHTALNAVDQALVRVEEPLEPPFSSDKEKAPSKRR
jgi:hypothetical protein